MRPASSRMLVRFSGVMLRPSGMENSPPTLKLAFSPLIAVRLGSARVRMTPAWFSARSCDCTVSPPELLVMRPKVLDSGLPRPNRLSVAAE